MKKYIGVVLLFATTAMAQGGTLEPVDGLEPVFKEPLRLRGGIAMDGWAGDSSAGPAEGTFSLRIPKGASIRHVFLASTLRARIEYECLGESGNSTKHANIPDEAYVSVALNGTERFRKHFSDGTGSVSLNGGWQNCEGTSPPDPVVAPITYWMDLTKALGTELQSQVNAQTYINGILEVAVSEEGDQPPWVEFPLVACQEFAVVGHNLIVVWEHESALLQNIRIHKGLQLPCSEDKFVELAKTPPMCTEEDKLHLQVPHPLSISVVGGPYWEWDGTVVVPKLELAFQNFWPTERLNEPFLLAPARSAGAGANTSPSARELSCAAMTTGAFGGAWSAEGAPPPYGWPQGTNGDVLHPQNPQEPGEESGLFNLSARGLKWPSTQEGASIGLLCNDANAGSALTLVVEQRPVVPAKNGPDDGQGVWDACADADGDGIPNRFDRDSDGDCLFDEKDSAPLEADEQACGPDAFCDQGYGKPGVCKEKAQETQRGENGIIGFASGGGSGCGSGANMAALLGSGGLLWLIRRIRRRR